MDKFNATITGTSREDLKNEAKRLGVKYFGHDRLWYYWGPVRCNQQRSVVEDLLGGNAGYLYGPQEFEANVDIEERHE